jgi:hypothetical protein
MTAKLFEIPSESSNQVESFARQKQTDFIIGEEVKEEFIKLASEWTQQTEGMSSTVEMSKHPAYQKIVSMGKAVIPFLLEDLHQNPLYWLPALRQITQENPVQPQHKGKIKLMAEDWLNWGKKQGYVA